MSRRKLCTLALKTCLPNRAAAARWRNYVAAWLEEPVTHFRTYHCKGCGLWHIGHTRQGRK